MSLVALKDSQLPEAADEIPPIGFLANFYKSQQANKAFVFDVTDNVSGPLDIDLSKTENVFNLYAVPPKAPIRRPENWTASTTTSATEIAVHPGTERFLQHRQMTLADGRDEMDIRLVSPPTPQKRIRVKIRYLGKERPRIAFDPDRDW